MKNINVVYLSLMFWSETVKFLMFDCHFNDQFSLIETSQLIIGTNQLTDFFMMGTLVVNGLTHF